MATFQRRTIQASDGTRLAIDEVGPADAPLTIVFSHGFCLTMNAWEPQRLHLTAELGDAVRLVFYDQRGHGRSEIPSDPDSYTLRQLGADLDSVVRATADSGPVVLVGHSMGGMAVLSFAAEHSDTLARVAGVALISTAASQLSSCGVGRALNTPAVPLLQFAARCAPRLTRHVWDVVRCGVAPLFGIPVAVRPAVRANRVCCQMVTCTPILTIVSLLTEFRNHDQVAALTNLAHLPVVVACGEADPITPMRHSLDLVRRLPGAELVRAPRAGHLLELERPRLVSDAIARLITRVNPARQMPPRMATA